MILVEREKYLEGLKAIEKLRLLEDGGVDAWMWYYDSLEPDDPDKIGLGALEEEIDKEVSVIPEVDIPEVDIPECLKT